MGEEAWSAGFNQCFGVRMPGDLIGEVDERGQEIKGDSILILMNAFHEPIPFKIPARVKGQRWQRLIDTALPAAARNWFASGKAYDLKGRSMVIFRTVAGDLAASDHARRTRRGRTLASAAPTREDGSGQPETDSSTAAGDPIEGT
jgi:hypothetical protein